MKPSGSWRTLLPLAIFGLALLVRLLHVLDYQSSPFFSFPIIDSATYDRMAWTQACGGPLWEGPFWQPPLYPWLLGILYAKVGHSLLWARLVQSLLGALSAVLLYAIGREVFGRAVGLMAGFAMALYGTLVYFDGEILIPSLYLFLLLAGLNALMRARRATRRGRWLLWLGAGMIFGLAALARPNVLLFLPVAALWGFWASRSAERPRRALGPCVFLFGASIVVSVVTLRNVQAGDDFVLISANGGLNFYIGNNPEAGRTVAIRPGFAWTRLVNEPTLRAGIDKPSGRSRYFYRKGLTFVREQPASALSLLAKKMGRFWNSFEIGRNRDVYAARQHSRLLSLILWRIGPFGFPFGLLAPLAFAGLVVSLSRDPGRVLLVLFLGTYMLSVVLYFVAARYRLPVVPMIVLFAAEYGRWLVERLRGGGLQPAALSLVVVFAAFPVVNQGIPAFDRIYRGETDRYLGVLHLDRGRRGEAEAAYRRAIAQDPDYAEAHAELGQLLRDDERYEEALVHLSRAKEICPWSEETHYLVGTAYAAVGRLAEAESSFRRAIAIAPYARAYRDLGVLLLAQGRLGEAHELLLAARQLDASDLDTWYKLGQCYFLMGEYLKAEEALRGALRLAPGDREIIGKIESLRALRLSAP